MTAEFDYTESYIYEVACVENALIDLSRLLLREYVPVFDEIINATDGLLASMNKVNGAFGPLDDDGIGIFSGEDLTQEDIDIMNRLAAKYDAKDDS